MDSKHSWMPHGVKRPVHYRKPKGLFQFLNHLYQDDETLKCLFNGTKLQVFTLFRWGRHVTAVMVTQCKTCPGAWGMSHRVTLTQYSTSSQRDIACPMCTGVIKPRKWHSTLNLENPNNILCECNFDHHIILWTSSLQFDNHFWSVSSLLIVTFLGLGSDQVWWFCWNLNQGSLISSSAHLEYIHKITKLDNNKLQAWKSNYKSISNIFPHDCWIIVHSDKHEFF